MTAFAFRRTDSQRPLRRQNPPEHLGTLCFGPSNRSPSIAGPRSPPSRHPPLRQVVTVAIVAARLSSTTDPASKPEARLVSTRRRSARSSPCASRTSTDPSSSLSCGPSSASPTARRIDHVGRHLLVMLQPFGRRSASMPLLQFRRVRFAVVPGVTQRRLDRILRTAASRFARAGPPSAPYCSRRSPARSRRRPG